MTHENCKKSGPFRVRLSAEKKLPTEQSGFFLPQGKRCRLKNKQLVQTEGSFSSLHHSFQSGNFRKLGLEYHFFGKKHDIGVK